MRMAYAKFNTKAELGKLSQGKQTTAPAWLVAKLAIDEIRDLERAVGRQRDVDDLERLFGLEDQRGELA